MCAVQLLPATTAMCVRSLRARARARGGGGGGGGPTKRGVGWGVDKKKIFNIIFFDIIYIIE